MGRKKLERRKWKRIRKKMEKKMNEKMEKKILIGPTSILFSLFVKKKWKRRENKNNKKMIFLFLSFCNNLLCIVKKTIIII